MNMYFCVPFTIHRWLYIRNFFMSSCYGVRFQMSVLFVQYHNFCKLHVVVSRETMAIYTHS
uniref:Uncharacterized protein n=1 Tax=Octopus bimaculoides TaxID=37653 RepID=A0A0L8GLB0_OCTBM